jgi:hypothetical protein
MIMAIVSGLSAGAIGPAQGQPLSQTSVQSNIRASAEQAVDLDGKACDASILPQRGARPATIIASLDYGGRSICNELVRVLPGTPPTLLQRIDTSGVWQLSSILIDVDHDGDPELVVPRGWGFGRRSQCEPLMHVIYQCGADTCLDVSHMFPEFYNREFDRVSQEISQIERLSPLAEAEINQLQCLTMERDRLRRFLGIDRLAGFQTAEQWMASADPDVRMNAVAVFSDIGGAASSERLKTLANDSDSTVALVAKDALKRLQTK